MDKPPRIKALGRRVWAWIGHTTRAYSFYGVVRDIFSLAVASIVTPWIARASEAFSGMPSPMQVVFFVGILGLVFVLILLLIQVLAYFIKPDLVKSRSESPNTEAGEQLPAETESLRSENASLRNRLENAEAAVENREAWLKPCLQREKYGEDLPVFAPLEPEAYGQMSSAVHELKPSLRDTLAGMNTVWDQLAAQIRFHKGEREWTLFVWRLDRVEKAERRYLEQVANALERVLENGREDPRPYLATTYSRYRQWRTEMARVAALFGGRGSLAFTVGSTQWMGAERRFLDDLRKKLARPELKAVQEIVEEYDRRHGPIAEISSDEATGLDLVQ